MVVDETGAAFVMSKTKTWWSPAVASYACAAVALASGLGYNLQRELPPCSEHMDIEPWLFYTRFNVHVWLWFGLVVQSWHNDSRCHCCWFHCSWPSEKLRNCSNLEINLNTLQLCNWGAPWHQQEWRRWCGGGGPQLHTTQSPYCLSAMASLPAADLDPMPKLTRSPLSPTSTSIMTTTTRTSKLKKD